MIVIRMSGKTGRITVDTHETPEERERERARREVKRAAEQMRDKRGKASGDWWGG